MSRWHVTLLSILGIGLVVFVFVILLSMAAGFRATLRATGRSDNGIVVQSGSISELTSWVPLTHQRVILTNPAVARRADGEALASPEIVVVTNLPRLDDRGTVGVTVRGVTSRAFDVRRGLRIVKGRGFAPGLYEVIAAERLTSRVRGLEPGARLRLQNQEWTVVGIFGSSDGIFDSEIWGDFDVIASSFKRQAGSNSLVVRLTGGPSAVTSLDAEIRTNPDMHLQAMEERQYYEDQAAPVSRPLLILATLVSIVMAIGAIFATTNTMYAVVAMRTREVGTLRALGFPRRTILLGFMLESVLLALVGGALGCLLAGPVDGLRTATAQVASLSEVAFAFRITPGILASAVLFAAVMGVIGGALPAIRAARLPIASALREC